MTGKILLVEDNADDAELTRLALERHNLGSRPVQLDEYMDKVSSAGRYWDTVNERLPGS